MHFFFIIFLATVTLINASDKPVALNAELLIPSVVKVKIQRNDTFSEESELIQSDSGGSGFVIDDEHHILTNEHVIKDAKKIFIIDHNNAEHIATLIAKDEKSDIAILDVPSFNAPKLRVGESTKTLLGDDVFVIGSPYSLGSSVTVGVVSSLKRSLQNYPYQYFIQTDAAINPGNSGGPLLNKEGEVIGVATMTFARSGNYTNIGFAIPIEEALKITDTLLKDKKITRGYAGMTLLISDKISRRLGYSASTLITYIEPNSPAELAGLRSGDIIIGLNGEKFTDNGVLHKALYSSHPNDTFSLTYVRDKKSFTTTLKLGAGAAPLSIETNLGSGDKAEKLGLILSESSTELRITNTFGAAKIAGFMAGDTIDSINGTAIKSIKELNLQLSKLKDNDLAFLTLRRNGHTFILVLGSKTAFQGYTTAN